MINHIRLYYTDGCHLCDNASALIEQLNLRYQKIDIIDSEHLVELYATHIPVVQIESGPTLYWPFSLQQLQQFIEEN